MRNAMRLLTGLTVVLALTVSANAAYYFYDDFNGPGNPLHGQLPDISVSGATWIAHSSLLDNGNFPKPVAPGANGVAAVLPFQPHSGQVYTVEASILNNHSRWVAVGFLSQHPNDETAKNYTMMDFAVRHSNTGYAWGLTRNHPTDPDQQTFNGFRTAGPVTGGAGDLVSPTSYVTITVVLDTNPAIWTAAYYINGVQRGATQTLSTAVMTGIKHVGISLDRRAATEPDVIPHIEYFSLVPEPASMGLLALGGLILLGRRRSA